MNIVNSCKWENFETEFFPLIKESVTEVYALVINESEASIITLENDVLVLNRFVDSDNQILSNDVDKFEFSNIRECLSYLRIIKEDHANNYDYKDLVKKLISQLYMNNHIKPEDVIA
jgi:hypothetical protein